MLNKGIEINPKHRTLDKTYRFRNSEVLDGGVPSWVDITAPTPAAAIEHLGWKVEDIDIAKVWKSSGKIGESGQVTPGGWSKLTLPGAQPKETRREREDRERRAAFQKQCQENEAKGLTMFGYPKAYDHESIELYINNKKMVCKVDYDMSTPHLEFRGEPCILTETGYRSHFMQGDLTGYASLKALVEEQVDYIIRNRYCQNSKAKYTLTWEPSLEYLKHSPEQLSLFGEELLCKN